MHFVEYLSLLVSCLKGEISMSDIKSRKPATDDEAQSGSLKSGDCVPGVPDPLCGSARIADDT